MGLHNIEKYTYKDIFSLRVVAFDVACSASVSEQIENFSIFWIRDGKGCYTIDFKTYHFNGETLFFLSPGQVFTVETEQIKEAYQLNFVSDFYCIQAHDKEVSCNGILFNNIYETPLVKPTEKDILQLGFVIEHLVNEFKADDTAQYDMLQAYLKQFMILSVRIKKEQHTLKANTETTLFKDFSTLVDQFFKTEHSVTDYANRLGVSPKTLSKHFKNAGLPSPSNYIKQRLLLEAKRQLLYTNNSIKNVAYNLGFNDPAYFTRFFAKHELKSPLQFKKEH